MKLVSYLHITILLSLLALISSCTDEDIIKRHNYNIEEGIPVVTSLKFGVEKNEVVTRSAASETVENTVTDLFVIAFNSSGNISSYRSENGENVSGGKYYGTDSSVTGVKKGTIRDFGMYSGQNQTIYAIANVAGGYTDLTSAKLLEFNGTETDFLNLAPHVDKGRRIIVVYPADAIRADAAATFLKSLEEPPERTTFLLVADDIDRVLPTIRSRCRLLRAKAPTHEESLNWLKSVGVDDAEEALARAAERPCLVTDERSIRNNTDIDAKVRDQLLTLTTMAPAIRMALLKTLAQGAFIELTNIAVKEGRSALPVSAVLPVLERWSYDLLAVKQGLEPHYFPAYSPQMKRLVSSVDAEKLFKYNDSLKAMRRVVTHPLNAQLIVEQAILRYRKTMANQDFD